MSKSDNPILDAIREIMKFEHDTPPSPTPTPKTTTDYMGELTSAIDGMFRTAYSEAFQSTMTAKGPVNWNPEKVMEDTRLHVRDIVETKLQKIMTDFHSRDDKR